MKDLYYLMGSKPNQSRSSAVGSPRALSPGEARLVSSRALAPGEACFSQLWFTRPSCTPVKEWNPLLLCRTIILKSLTWLPIFLNIERMYSDVFEKLPIFASVGSLESNFHRPFLTFPVKIFNKLHIFCTLKFHFSIFLIISTFLPSHSLTVQPPKPNKRF